VTQGGTRVETFANARCLAYRRGLVVGRAETDCAPEVDSIAATAIAPTVNNDSRLTMSMLGPLSGSCYFLPFASVESTTFASTPLLATSCAANTVWITLAI
jgi:hypothetical protein